MLTIGTYDGIHLGHQALLARLHEHAVRRGEPAVLMTFEPMPREFLVSNDPPARLTSLRERWRILSGTRLARLRPHVTCILHADHDVIRVDPGHPRSKRLWS